MVLQNNMPAQSAGRYLKANRSELSKSIEKVASGYQINCAGDNAAGLAISEKMRAEITATNQASENVEDGINLVKTGEGAMQEIQDIMNRLKELSVLSANGTFEDGSLVDRYAYQAEVGTLLAEVDRIADSTNFNGVYLLNGTTGLNRIDLEEFVEDYFSKYATVSEYISVMSDGVGIDDVSSSGTSTMSVEVTVADAAVIPFEQVAENTSVSDGIFTMSFDYVTPSGTTETLSFSDSTVGNPMSEDECMAAIRNGLESNDCDALVFIDEGNIYIRFNDGSEILNPITVGDGSVNATTESVTTESLNIANFKTGDSLKLNGVTYMMVPNPVGDYQVPEGVVGVPANHAVGTYSPNTYQTSFLSQIESIYDASASTDLNGNLYYLLSESQSLVVDGTITLQIGTTNDSYNMTKVPTFDMSTKALGIENFDISTQQNAIDSISTIVDVINTVSTARSEYGAIQNRLEYTLRNLQGTEENLQAAESTIRDTDIADEMMKYTKNNMLTGASETMLSHALEFPDLVLQFIESGIM